MVVRWIIGLLVVSSLLGACTLPQENIQPPGKPGALYTEAAQTVAALGEFPTPFVDEATGTTVTEAGSPPIPDETFEIPTFTPSGTENGTPLPCDRVRFIKDVTIPDEMDMAPGEMFTKTWRLENAGSCPWTIGYLLYFDSGDIMEGPTSQFLTSEPILPGERVDVSLDLVAPLENGTYQGNWKLRNVKGEGFGIGDYSKSFWVKINVVDGSGLMFDFNVQADDAAWGSGSVPVNYIDPGENILDFDMPGTSGDPYVALLDQQFLEGGEISGVVLATYPPQGAGNYVIGRFPNYTVNAGDLLFGRVGLTTNFNGICGSGDVIYRINLMVADDPSTLTTLWEWNEVCDARMKSFEIDLDSYQGETIEVFLVVLANNDSSDNQAVWDSLSVHR
jgi:hypothetical protein